MHAYYICQIYNELIFFIFILINMKQLNIQLSLYYAHKNLADISCDENDLNIDIM